MNGRSSQRKGRGGEIEICHIFQAHGIDAQPGQAVSYGSTPDVLNIPGVHPEIKRVERLNVPEAMAQAVRDSEKFHDGRRYYSTGATGRNGFARCACRTGWAYIWP